MARVSECGEMVEDVIEHGRPTCTGVARRDLSSEDVFHWPSCPENLTALYSTETPADHNGIVYVHVSSSAQRHNSQSIGSQRSTLLALLIN